jgi:hypothetical protein
VVARSEQNEIQRTWANIEAPISVSTPKRRRLYGRL